MPNQVNTPLTGEPPVSSTDLAPLAPLAGLFRRVIQLWRFAYGLTTGRPSDPRWWPGPGALQTPYARQEHFCRPCWRSRGASPRTWTQSLADPLAARLPSTMG